MSSSTTTRPVEVAISLPAVTLAQSKTEKELRTLIPNSQTTVLIRAGTLNGTFQLNTLHRREAGLAHAVATLAPTPCEHCHLGLGIRPFVECKVVNGFLGGQCTNCKAAAGHGTYCTFTTNGLITEHIISRRFAPQLRQRAIQMAPLLHSQWLSTVRSSTNHHYFSVMFTEEILQRFGFSRSDRVAGAYFSLARPVLESALLNQASLVSNTQKVVHANLTWNSLEGRCYNDAAACGHLGPVMTAIVKERSETWSLLVTHPFFRYLKQENRDLVKKCVAVFFNRRYTIMVAEITKATGVLGKQGNAELLNLLGMTAGEELLLHLRDEGQFGYVAGLLGHMNGQLEEGEEAWDLAMVNEKIWTRLLM